MVKGMKIDNNLFLFMLEKKKKGGTFFPVLLCVILLLGMFGGGFALGQSLKGDDGKGNTPVYADNRDAAADGETAAADETGTENAAGTGNVAVPGNPEDEYVEGNYITSDYLASMVREKYEEDTSAYGYTYGTAITGLSRKESIVLQAGFDIEDLGITYWTEIIGLFYDPELTYSVGPNWAYNEETREITISPSNYPAGNIYVSGMRTDIVNRYAHDDIVFFPEDAGTAWGNAGTMYLATYIDLETGEKLEKPQVQVVTIEGELADTPRLSYSFTEDGRVHLYWNEVEGAREYFVCHTRISEEYGMNDGLSVMANVTENEWTSPAPEFGSIFANKDFSNYEVAEDDWYDEYKREERIAEYGEEPVFVYEADDRKGFCVIAVSEDGTSMMSNVVDILELQDNIPTCIAYNTWNENGYSYTGYEKIEELISYGYVTMANGMTATKLLDFDTEKAMVVDERYINVNEDGSYESGETISVLKIPFRIEGTPFEDVALVLYYDESRLEEGLAFIEEREELLRKRAGEVALSTDIEFDEKETADGEVREVDFAITANSALSEYLAANMLSGVKIIDVSDFYEAADTDLLADALMEAYYQNPLILGISGYRMNRTGTAVKVVYEDSAQDMAVKQEEIKEKVTEIIAEIITPDMTELEKELAINQYLCDTCEYDNAALENAEQNDYKYVDSKFDDSFTAYGALINGKCVCAGYAGAFKLLADAAGLESVVVTGMLDGNLPHAWNKVKIDGEWEILDVTNNDSEFIANALLNLPDEAGSRILTEDGIYAMDSYLADYTATNGQREYYRINNLYYDYDEIIDKLVEQLEEDGVALLRTEYFLDDETFNEIGQEVYKSLEADDKLYGYYWMGVIYLTTEEEK